MCYSIKKQGVVVAHSVQVYYKCEDQWNRSADSACQQPRWPELNPKTYMVKKWSIPSICALDLHIHSSTCAPTSTCNKKIGKMSILSSLKLLNNVKHYLEPTTLQVFLSGYAKVRAEVPESIMAFISKFTTHFWKSNSKESTQTKILVYIIIS